jgi:hypothetical protein
MFSITDDFPLPPGPIHTIFILSGWFYIADASYDTTKEFYDYDYFYSSSKLIFYKIYYIELIIQ